MQVPSQVPAYFLPTRPEQSPGRDFTQVVYNCFQMEMTSELEKRLLAIPVSMAVFLATLRDGLCPEVRNTSCLQIA